MSDIPRATEPNAPVVPSGGSWNKVVDRTDQSIKISAAPPLNVSQSASGTRIWLTEDPRKRPFLKITSAKGPSGVYGAKKGKLKSGFKFALASGAVVTPDDIFDWPDDEDSIFYNQPELFNNPVTHWINVTGSGFTFADKSEIPNDGSLPGYEENYAKSLKDVDWDNATKCIRKTFVNQPIDPDDFTNIVCFDPCTPP